MNMHQTANLPSVNSPLPDLARAAITVYTEVLTEGGEAFDAGRAYSDPPYPDGDYRRTIWQQGFSIAATAFEVVKIERGRLA